MRNRRKYLIYVGTLAALLGVTTAAFAQPAVPAAPAPPAGASGLLGLIQAAAGAIKAAKAKCCACPLGQMMQNMAKPINMMLGGLLCPPCCPPVSDEAKKMPSTTPGGACAKITLSEIEVPQRRKAIQCLAQFDCHWWPEAEAALISGLRTDTSECVRLEAATVLKTGCCCTKRIIAALTICVNGSKKDGNPSENSERVKQVAVEALKHCLQCYREEIDELQKPEPGEKKPPPPPGVPPVPPPPVASATWEDMARIAWYYREDEPRSAEVLADAHRVVDQIERAQTTQVANVPPGPTGSTVAGGTGSRNLYSIMFSAKGNDNAAGSPPYATPVAQTFRPVTPVALTPVATPPTAPTAPSAPSGTVRAELRFQE